MRVVSSHACLPQAGIPRIFHRLKKENRLLYAIKVDFKTSPYSLDLPGRQRQVKGTG